MNKLKISSLQDEKPIRLTLEIPAALHRDLLTYCNILAREEGEKMASPDKLIVPMVERFIKGDRVFTKFKNNNKKLT
ncbi:MAG: DUF2274 domain-containing protein [Alphaproteobacteria bacterium]|nr:DUF2274 domain-containing protein [Alphaproteobacteria bacterium]